jgi:hypothetical protein
MRRRCSRHAQCSASPTRQVGFGYLLCCSGTGTYIVTVRAVDPDSLDPDPGFQVNPDPIRIQGFDDQRLKIEITAENFLYLFLDQICNYVQVTEEAFSPQKRTSITSKK